MENKFFSTKEVINTYNNTKDMEVIAEKYEIGDFTRPLQFVRDAMAMDAFGFDMVNASVNGWDGFRTSDKLWFENKTKSLNTYGGIKLQDTKKAKAQRFGAGNVILSATIYQKMFTPMLCIIGNSALLYNDMMKNIEKSLQETGKRVSPPFSLPQLVNTYGFKIVVMNGFTKEEAVAHMKSRHKKAFKNLTVDNIYTTMEASPSIKVMKSAY